MDLAPWPSLPQTMKKHQDVLVQPELAAGDVILFSEAATHGALPWKPKEVRLTPLASAMADYGPAAYRPNIRETIGACP